MKVLYWTAYNYDLPDGIEKYKQNTLVGGMGGCEDRLTWEEYTASHLPEAKPYLDALFTEISEKKIRMTGEQHQIMEYGAPVFEDLTVSTFSYRGWGDVMASAWNTIEGERKYNYMDFYM